ncbi:MAG: S1/P1 nuclease [Rhodospirillaceae bacterium]
MIRTFFGLLLLLSAPAPAQAWSRDAHRMSCAIALDIMSKSVRTQAFSLLDIDSSEEFLELCIWADRLKASQPETAAWHEMLLPREAEGIDIGRDCPPPHGCVLTRVIQEISTLKSDAPKEERATALRLLMHLIADLHQPLNLGFENDGGGKKIPAIYLGRKTTLYDIWDALLFESERVAPGNTLETLWLAHEVQTHPEPLDWARESYFIMRTPPTGYVGNPGGLTFDETYVRQNRPIAMGQLEKAGVRLGLTLNQALQ